MGVKGKACEGYRELFEKILQYRVVDDIHTEEYYEEVEEIENVSEERVRV